MAFTITAASIATSTFNRSLIPIVPLDTIGGLTHDIPIYYAVPANVRYVSNAGNDITGNGTSGNPFLTITRALTGLTDPASVNGNGGCLIILEAGTYALPVLLTIVGFNSFTIWLVGDRTSGSVTIDCANAAINNQTGTSKFRFRWIDFTNVGAINMYNSSSNFDYPYGRPFYAAECSFTFSSLSLATNLVNGTWTNRLSFLDCTITGAIMNTNTTVATPNLSPCPATITNNFNAGYSFYRCRLVNCSYVGAGGHLVVGSGTPGGGVERLIGCTVVNSGLPFTGTVLAWLTNNTIDPSCWGAGKGINFVLLTKVYSNNSTDYLEYGSGSNTALSSIWWGGSGATISSTVKVWEKLLFVLSKSLDAHPMHPNRTNNTNTVASLTIGNSGNTIGYGGLLFSFKTLQLNESTEQQLNFKAQIGQPEAYAFPESTVLNSLANEYKLNLTEIDYPEKTVLNSVSIENQPLKKPVMALFSAIWQN